MQELKADLTHPKPNIKTLYANKTIYTEKCYTKVEFCDLTTLTQIFSDQTFTSLLVSNSIIESNNFYY